MRNKTYSIIHSISGLVILLLLVLLTSCSTTKNLPKGEVLYTGQTKMDVDKAPDSKTGVTAMEELNAALAKAPNNSFFGSSRYRIPFPMGLWTYNSFVRYEKGFGHWIFKVFASKPIFISTVNPDIRSKIGTNILHDFGYFNGKVDYDVIPHKNNDRKAKIHYKVNMGDPYLVDTLTYEKFERSIQNIVNHASRWSKVKAGSQFNVLDLDAERNRINSILRNLGYYYFRPDLLAYQADTTLVDGQVSLRMRPIPGLPSSAQRKYYIGDTSFYLLGKNGETPNDSIHYRDLVIYYHDKLKVRPNMLYRWVNSDQYSSSMSTRRKGRKKLYSQNRHERMQERLSEIGIFKHIETQYLPKDSTLKGDTLDLNIQTALELPMDAEIDLNITTKSNDQVGPGAIFTLGRRNVFGGGEKWDIQLRGSYEWQTGNKGTNSSLMNSYELGVSTSLTFPRLFFPKLHKREYDFPASTTFQIYGDQLNRARYYRILSFGGKVSYDLQPKLTQRHTITPFRLTFNVLRSSTAEFDSIADINPALYISLQNQFIPAMEYTYTYDNASIRKQRNRLWWQTTFTSSGNLTSLIYAATGQSLSKREKNLLGSPFAQFVKVNSEFRYTWNFNKNHALATRIAGGVIWSYGNSRVAPYSEQFYVGGANSIRAFTVRSIGPGGYAPDKRNNYSFIDQTGDIRFEANAEYRFKIAGNLNGAVFLDAGNVWLLRDDPVVEGRERGQRSRQNGKFKLADTPKQIALGTGMGLRYDFGFLVIRVDCGIGIHAPYETTKKGYYNIEKFKDGLGFHFAVGYPF